MKRISVLMMVVMWICGMTTPAVATLVDRGGGLIYDTDLNITWLSDANYAKTSGYSDDGLMDRNAGRVWADNLVYGGYDDWRLPTTVQPDPACSGQNYGISWYTHCTGSEMGHLFYDELGGTALASILASSDPDLSFFTNLQPDYYWSVTDYVPGSSTSWDFGFGDGLQRAGNVSTAYALAVRSGEVSAPVPEPGTLLLLGSGLIGAAAWRKPLSGCRKGAGSSQERGA